MDLEGWVEIGGRRATLSEIAEILASRPHDVSGFGGEFLLSWEGCIARDRIGIIPGPVEPGTVVCEGRVVCRILPDLPDLDLGSAISEAVRLRCDQGVVAFSGGVDSSLIAALSGLPCIAVGVPGSHDLVHAGEAAALLGLDYTGIEITENDIRDGLHEVLAILPEVTPVEASLAIAQYLITRSAADLGYPRILSGQGADELFAGYSRYLRSSDLGGELTRDFGRLLVQVSRDQTIAALHGTRFSFPYLDVRVVRAAGGIPAGDLLKGGIRKRPLREVAAGYIPPEIAWKEKKAMQYGSGIWKVLQKSARHNGYKNSVQGYLNQLTDKTGTDQIVSHHDRRKGR